MRKAPALLALAAVFLAALFFAQSAPPAQAPAPASSVVASAPQPVEWNAPIWTGGERNARQHWEKHAGEFPEFRSMQDYVNAVHRFLLKPPPGTLIKHRDNGDTLYFDPASGVFAVQAASGAPRTFFKPDNGMAYWSRQ